MELFTPIPNDASSSLGMALVLSSATPLLLLNADLVVQAASASFCSAFSIDPATVVGAELASLGGGEWGTPKLQSLLRATVAGSAAIDAYEFDLVRPGRPTLCLVIHAHKLDYGDADEVRLAVAVTDITQVRAIEKQKDDVVREKQVLFQELQHRVANSLQIIASVLMQSARKVQSDEARAHLNDAHHRVMSIATLQRQLAATRADQVSLRPYLTELCASIAASMIYDSKVLTLRAQVDDSVTSSEVSVSLGLIVTELVINSLKHAYPERQGVGMITVDYRTTPSGWTLTVADDGVGMSGGEGDHQPGLGSGIVDALSKQLEATVEIRDMKPGTGVSITHTDS